MKIVLLGNYEYSFQQSMQRFSHLLEDGLRAAGHEVLLIKPSPFFGRLRPADKGFGKWLGYIDRFLIFPFYLRRIASSADVVHICDHSNAMYVRYLGDVPHVVTCHDVMAIRAAAGELGQAKASSTGKVFQSWILGGLRLAKLVVCVSEQTANELAMVSGRPRALLRVVPNAQNYPYSPMAATAAQDIFRQMNVPLPLPFFLHVGGNQWYKNRLGVLKIFYELSRFPAFSRHRLVMVGKEWPSELRDFVRSNGLVDKVYEYKNLENEEVRALYSLTDALIFPSLHEGFGWPIIEAQACGAIVATTNKPPMCDVAGEGAAILMDSSDVHAAALRIAEALASDVVQLRKKGLENAEKYSCDAMVSGYLMAYELAKEAGNP